MDIINTITGIITDVGFPIAVCFICFWYINKQGERHSIEMEQMTQAVNNNTTVLEKISTKIGGEKNDI